MEIKKIYQLNEFQQIGGSLVADASILGWPPGYIPTSVVVQDILDRRFWRHDIKMDNGDWTSAEYKHSSGKMLIVIND